MYAIRSYYATYLNNLTTTFVTRAFLPTWYDTEQEALETMMFCLRSIPQDEVRLVHIPNTLYLTDCFVSEAVLKELTDSTRFSIVHEPRPVLVITSYSIHYTKLYEHCTMRGNLLRRLRCASRIWSIGAKWASPTWQAFALLANTALKVTRGPCQGKRARNGSKSAWALPPCLQGRLCALRVRPLRQWAIISPVTGEPPILTCPCSDRDSYNFV